MQFILMVINTMVNTLMVFVKARVNISMPMVINMRVILKIIRSMVSGN